ncbi:MAG: hypothetical protein OXN21_10930 [Chloroflexota bacterium]|nr:hypothetical protein [Chloroflexota bacterium]
MAELILMGSGMGWTYPAAAAPVPAGRGLRGQIVPGGVVKAGFSDGKLAG